LTGRASQAGGRVEHVADGLDALAEQPVLFTLAVDGEMFAVRRAAGGGTNYDWLSGPNKGYGFGSSGRPTRSAEEHREHIRTFLAMIDPATSYIGDE
jgi:hypothetical protein